MDIAIYPPGLHIPTLSGHDATRGGERIERLNRLVGMLMCHSSVLGNIVSLNDRKGTLFVTWASQPSKMWRLTVEACWAELEMQDLGVHHAVTVAVANKRQSDALNFAQSARTIPAIDQYAERTCPRCFRVGHVYEDTRFPARPWFFVAWEATEHRHVDIDTLVSPENLRSSTFGCGYCPLPTT